MRDQTNPIQAAPAVPRALGDISTGSSPGVPPWDQPSPSGAPQPGHGEGRGLWGGQAGSAGLGHPISSVQGGLSGIFLPQHKDWAVHKEFFAQ